MSSSRLIEAATVRPELIWAPTMRRMTTTGRARTAISLVRTGRLASSVLAFPVRPLARVAMGRAGDPAMGEGNCALGQTWHQASRPEKGPRVATTGEMRREGGWG